VILNQLLSDATVSFDAIQSVQYFHAPLWPSFGMFLFPTIVWNAHELMLNTGIPHP
jgi:hypothetical protein